MLGATHQVDFSGRRGRRTAWARGVDCHVFPATERTLIDPQTAPRFRYAIHWDPEATMDDGSSIGEGDILRWDAYPGQPLALSAVTIADNGLGLVVLTGYFMPVAESGGVGGQSP